MKKNFNLKSSDNQNILYGTSFIPDGEVKAVIQLIHGMCEYIELYEEFAEAMNKRGIAVIGVDLLGHGFTATSLDDLGFFAERNGKKYLLADQHKLTAMIKDEYPGTPIFIMGFSLGSFIARRYITIWGDEVDGALILGTGTRSAGAATLGMFLATVVRFFKGARHRSKLLYYLTNGLYNIIFKLKLKGSWLSHNKEDHKMYEINPLCNFIFTVSAYHTMFSIMRDLALEKNDDRIPKDLPVCFYSGMEDPVGNYTKGVLKTFNEYVHLGIKDVDVKFYPKDRHEILREADREDVFYDIYTFIEEKSH